LTDAVTGWSILTYGTASNVLLKRMQGESFSIYPAPFSLIVTYIPTPVPTPELLSFEGLTLYLLNFFLYLGSGYEL